MIRYDTSSTKRALPQPFSLRLDFELVVVILPRLVNATLGTSPFEMYTLQRVVRVVKCMPHAKYYFGARLEGTKRAISANMPRLRPQRDLRTASILLDIVNFTSELCRRRSGVFTEVACLVPPAYDMN